ncbi:hypothetical protein U1Q18_040510 [Sarracenia purpurea var. burkii]
MMIYLTRVPSEIRILARSTDRYRLTPADQLFSLSATALQGPLFSIAALPQPRQELLVVAQPPPAGPACFVIPPRSPAAQASLLLQAIEGSGRMGVCRLEESPKPGPEESSFEGASDDSDISSCSDDSEYVEVERDPILNEKGVSVSKVVTGEGTENKVSLEPSLFINCDRDNAVVVEEFADVGVKVK